MPMRYFLLHNDGHEVATEAWFESLLASMFSQDGYNYLA